MTYKEFWINKVSEQIYLLGVNFPREYRIRLLPKQTIKTLQTYYFEYKRICLKAEFKIKNVPLIDSPFGKMTNWDEIRPINIWKEKQLVRLTKRIIKAKK